MKEVNDNDTAKALVVQWRLLDEKESVIDACYYNYELRIMVCAMLTDEEDREFENLIESREG